MNYRPRAVDMSRVWLQPGDHNAPVDPMAVPCGCAMEICSYLGGEPWTSRPRRVAPFFVGFVRILNDVMDPHARQGFKPLLWEMVGTNDDPAAAELPDLARCYLVTEVITRRIAPGWLERMHLHDLSVRALALPTIRDARSAAHARDGYRDMRETAYAFGHRSGDVADRLANLAATMVMLDVNNALGRMQAGSRAAEALASTVDGDNWDEVVPLCETLLQVTA